MQLIAKRIAVLLLSLWLSGCYYTQAVQGHLELMSKREPIEVLLDDASTDAELAKRLALVQEARAFAINELELPDNGSYETFADLGRDQVLWNVFATPEFSLEPHTWCYPIVGCLSYRGYFKKAAAERQAEKLKTRGLDVAVGGVTAYSTLGRFKDPVVSPMLRWNDTRLVAVLFHELAHQVIYIKNDTTFNESFASAVEEIGVERWLRQRGDEAALRAYRERLDFQGDIVALVEAARVDLQAVFELPDAEQRSAAKARRLGELSDAVAELLSQRGFEPRHWLIGELNNARLLPIAIYRQQVPAFRAIFAACNEQPPCLYAETRRLGALDKAARDAALAELANLQH